MHAREEGEKRIGIEKAKGSRGPNVERKEIENTNVDFKEVET